MQSNDDFELIPLSQLDFEPEVRCETWREAASLQATPIYASECEYNRERRKYAIRSGNIRYWYSAPNFRRAASNALALPKPAIVALMLRLRTRAMMA